MNTANKTKQGKLDERIIIEELLKKPRKKLKEIAVLAGSLATSEEMKSRAVTQKIASSSNIQLALEEDRNKQRMRAFRRQKKADELIDWDIVASNPALAFNIVDKSERLLHESIKSSSDVIQEEKRENNNSSNMTVEQIEAELKKALENKKRLTSIIEGEVVE